MIRRRPITYPFLPKSCSSLEPGQFWAIPLSDGTFGCGRVIELAPLERAGSRVMFLAGLLDWHSSEPPTESSIAGSRCLAQGSAHIKTILETGGRILGHRPLALDGIEPVLSRDRHATAGARVQRGFTVIRHATPEDYVLPVFSTWGYRVIVVYAERHLVQRQNGA